MAEVKVEEEKGGFLRYLILFVIFMAIGVVIGILGTQKYMEYKDSKKEEAPVIDEGPEDITNVEEYTELINKLHKFVVDYSLFYTTKGVKVENMPNNDRLLMAYDYVSKDSNTIVEEKLESTLGSNSCLDTFALDDSSNLWRRDNGCTIKKVKRSLLEEKNTQLFNDKLIDTSSSFVNSEYKFCIVSEEYYYCGNKLDETINTGKLESKFSVIKATKDEGKIELYEKGYLLDTRSIETSLIGGHDKYYLHSSDSKDYYYELRNADNLTFKHTFVTTDRINYYYVSSEIVKE